MFHGTPMKDWILSESSPYSYFLTYSFLCTHHILLRRQQVFCMIFRKQEYRTTRSNRWRLRQSAQNMADAQNAKTGGQVNLSPNVFVGDCDNVNFHICTEQTKFQVDSFQNIQNRYAQCLTHPFTRHALSWGGRSFRQLVERFV
jgi:hypothetical protein